MKSKKNLAYHKRSKEEIDDFLKKLELQALETAEERIPLYLEVGLKDANKILDVGCGSGIVTRDIARLTKGKVIGVDGSSDMIDVAKKVLKNHVKAKATDKHPEQVEIYSEDERVARIITDTWCGMITPAEKSALLGKVDKLLRAVKKARQKANTTEVVDISIGKELFDYIKS